MIPDFDKCVLLLPFKGSNNGTTFTDFSRYARAASVFGGAKTTTAQSKYYGSSGYFDGNGDYLSLADSPDWDFGTGDYTIELWIKPSVNNATQTILSSYSSWPGAVWLHLCLSSAGKVWYRAGSNVPINLTGTTTIPTTSWSHVAITCAAGVTRLFVNGEQEGSTQTVASLACSHAVGIGYELTGNTAYLNGYLQDLLIVNGAALYASEFTPPRSRTGLISNAGMGVPAILDDAGVPAARRIQAIPRAYYSIIGVEETASNSDGRYSFDVPDIEYNILIHDDDTGTQYSDILVSRVFPAPA